MAEESGNEHGFTEVPEQQPAPQPKSCALRLRGLPFSAGEEDVRHFFSGFNVAQVVIGKRAGTSIRQRAKITYEVNIGFSTQGALLARAMCSWTLQPQLLRQL